MPAARLFPRRTLENALRVPEALKQHNAGNSWPSEEVATALDLGPSSGNFFYVTAASRDYGLTEGTRDTAQISLTPLGRKAVYPNGPDEEAAARLDAFLNVDAFKGVLEYYGGNNLPDMQFLSNTLTTTFNLPEDQHDEFVDLFRKNCRFLGIGETFDIASRTSSSGKRHIRDAVPDAEGGGDTVVVGHPRMSMRLPPASSSCPLQNAMMIDQSDSSMRC